MKKLSILILLALTIASCKTETKKEIQSIEKELSILEKVAYAHGYEAWRNVNEIQFTFNVDRDSSHFERNWTWRPKTNDVILKSKLQEGEISYNRNSLDSITTNADKGFINDKYWLLAPFNLIWDKGLTHTYIEKAEAPISKQEMKKLTIVYSNEGGYTPGDAYDFYFGDDFIIKEWVFREANSEKASLITTWEDYETFNGLKIAKTHQRDIGNWKLSFTDISVK